MVLRLLFCVSWMLVACGRETGSQAPAPAGASLTFADAPSVYWAAPATIARKNGLFERHGLDLQVLAVNSGAEAKNAVVSGAADIGLVADTPIAIGAFAQEPTRLIGTYVTVERVMKLVARPDSDIHSIEGLRSKKVGIVPATISELTLDRWLVGAGMSRADVTTVVMKPPDLPTALGRGDIDAFVAWEPLGLQAIQALDPDPVVIADPPVYTVTLHLVTRPDVLETKHDALRAFFQAILAAETIAAADPVGSRHTIEQAIGYPPDLLAPVWADLSIRLHADPALTRDKLRAEAEWALERKLVEGAVPDFSQKFDVSLLREVAPDRVRE